MASVKRVDRGAWEGCVHVAGKTVYSWGGTEKIVKQGCVNMIYTYALGKAEAAR